LINTEREREERERQTSGQLPGKKQADFRVQAEIVERFLMKLLVLEQDQERQIERETKTNTERKTVCTN
jgi:hypothetical protein